jgi:hypothetical protein
MAIGHKIALKEFLPDALLDQNQMNKFFNVATGVFIRFSTQ